MAKVTIVIEDTDDGGISVSLDWDPPADTDSGTTAQVAAMMCLDALQANSTEFEEIED